MPETKTQPAAFVNSIGIKMVYIPPGTFMMGSPPDEVDRKDDEVYHRVTISKGFYLASYHVTQEQWRVVMGKNHSKFKNMKQPAEQIRWLRIHDFIDMLNEAENKKGLLGFLKKGKQKTYRLPTEAEWEYACRAGTEYPFNCGKTIFTDQANYDGSKPYGPTGRVGVTRKAPMKVGSFKPNAWDLYDMHGNVSDWCSDLYAAYELPVDDDGPGLIDPTGPDKPPKEGATRVVRGGSFRTGAADCRAAARRAVEEGTHYDDVGLRLAMDLEE